MSLFFPPEVSIFLRTAMQLLLRRITISPRPSEKLWNHHDKLSSMETFATFLFFFYSVFLRNFNATLARRGAKVVLLTDNRHVAVWGGNHLFSHFQKKIFETCIFLQKGWFVWQNVLWKSRWLAPHAWRVLTILLYVTTFCHVTKTSSPHLHYAKTWRSNWGVF